ncbi:hypothetical protein NW762_001295 [Fusarium torreyae]|uniref:DOC domain-containing protein n=1 Tax=Fusarium torreyae TaxID=1237075 RepID=A0A9W8SFE4_9HYPO|nr:hypothetical protein NW762_001295 [Fusarium torreyae]
MPSRRRPSTQPRNTNSGFRKRVPLGELPYKKSSGTILCKRKRGFRPIPSCDKENTEAVVTALEQLHRSIVQRIRELEAELQRIRAFRDDIDGLLAAQPADQPRLSMPPLDSDESSSEPDVSILDRNRRPVAAPTPRAPSPFHGNRAAEEEEASQGALSAEEYEGENSSIQDEDVEDEEDEPVEQEQVQDVAPLFDPATAGLKEISNLARFTVSSHKPGNGVEELKSDDLKLFWQSDGPQPHKLTMYFTKRVGIRDIRFYVDYNEDESYTPTKVIFKAGTSENNLIEFATMALENPVGWQQVPIAGAGGDPDGNTLVAWVVQMQILENHQNGKDTHLRGIKIYSFDNDSAVGPGRDGNPVHDVVGLMDEATSRTDVGAAPTRLSTFGTTHFEPGEGGLSIPDFMREPEIR